jgi:hypothetical protein
LLPNEVRPPALKTRLLPTVHDIGIAYANVMT